MLRKMVSTFAQPKMWALVAVGLLCALLGLGLIDAGVVPQWIGVAFLVSPLVIGATLWLIVLRRGTTTKSSTLTVVRAPERVLGAAGRHLRAAGAAIVEHTEDHLVADLDPSIWSFGEQVRVDVAPLDDRSTAVTITSTSALPTAVDYGKNERNINHLVNALKSDPPIPPPARVRRSSR